MLLINSSVTFSILMFNSKDTFQRIGEKRHPTKAKSLPSRNWNLEWRTFIIKEKRTINFRNVKKLRDKQYLNKE